MAASGAGGAFGASGAGGAFGTSGAATWRSSAMILQPNVHSQTMLSREKALDVRMGAGQKKGVCFGRAPSALRANLTHMVKIA